jgi:hypothetical protein
MAQREIEFDRLEHFVDELGKLGVRKIAFTEVQEKRALQVRPDTLQVTDVALLEILAYRESTIYKVRITDADFDSIHDMLLQKGFEIVRRSRNIT